MWDSAALMKNNPADFQTGGDWWWFCVFSAFSIRHRKRSSFSKNTTEGQWRSLRWQVEWKCVSIVTCVWAWVSPLLRCSKLSSRPTLLFADTDLYFLLPLIIRHFGHSLTLFICALEIHWTWIEWVKVVKSSTSLNCCFSCVFRFQRSSTPRSAMPSVYCRGQRSPSSRSGPDTQTPVNMLLCVLKTHPHHFFSFSYLLLALCLGWEHDQFHQRGNQSEEQLPDVQVSILKPRISSFPSKKMLCVVSGFSQMRPPFSFNFTSQRASHSPPVPWIHSWRQPRPFWRWC